MKLLKKRAVTLIYDCGALESNEHLVIVSDSQTKKIAYLLAEVASQVTQNIDVITIPAMGIHGQEPPPEEGAGEDEGEAVRERMEEQG